MTEKESGGLKNLLKDLAKSNNKRTTILAGAEMVVHLKPASVVFFLPHTSSFLCAILYY
jgi:hypothetical protein